MNETYQHPGRWNDKILTPAPFRSDSYKHRMTYTITGLENNSVYEAIVQAKNRYGWNEVRFFILFYLNFILRLCLGINSCGFTWTVGT